MRSIVEDRTWRLAPRGGRLYQLWKSPQVGQATEALTSASKATPQWHT
jgi:hypothetical protein